MKKNPRFALYAALAALLAAVACAGPTPSGPSSAATQPASTGGRLPAALSTTSHDDTPRFVEGNAVVIAVVTATSCPTLSFTVEGHTIVTTATTQYSSGECADIRPGRPLTIQGTLVGTTVTATHISLKGNHPTEVEGNATILSLVTGTTCPTLSFLVEGHRINADAQTIYRNGTCTDLAANVHVQIKGLLLPNDVVAATQITFKNGDDD